MSEDNNAPEVTPEAPAAEAKAPAEEKAPKSYDEAYVKELRDEAAKHRTEKQAEKAARDKLEKELKAFRDAQLSDEEKARAELEDLRKSSTDNLSRAQEAELKFQIALNAPKEEISDIKAAIKLIERDALEFDDKGNITNLKDTLAALKEEHPWLLGKAAAPVAPHTGTTNPPKQQTGKKATLEDLRRLQKTNPEEVVRMRTAGELNHLLGGKHA